MKTKDEKLEVGILGPNTIIYLLLIRIHVHILER
jgi:hypothetical protein